MLASDYRRLEKLMRWILVASAFLIAACGKSDIEIAQERVTSMMRDPGSVEFRNVQSCAAEAGLIRGEVNAKNGLGGYVGFTPFFYDRGAVTVVDDTMDNPEGRKFLADLARRCG